MKEELIIIGQDKFLQLQRDLYKEVLDKLLIDINKANQQEEVLTIEQVCKLLGKSRNSIHLLTKEKGLKKRYIGGSVRYLKSEVLCALVNDELKK